MNNNFVHREKQRRMEHARSLWKKGTTLHDIAKSMDLNEQTVKKYLEDAQKVESAHSKETMLSSFVTKTTTMDTLFANALEEGFKCVRCKRYAKREAGILWEGEVFLCRVCYLGLTNEELRQFK